MVEDICNVDRGFMPRPAAIRTNDEASPRFHPAVKTFQPVTPEIYRAQIQQGIDENPRSGGLPCPSIRHPEVLCVLR